MENAAVSVWLVGILLSAIGACVLLGINLLLRALRTQSDAQAQQGVAIARIDAQLPSLVERVNSLHAWRNELQRVELERERAENERLRERLQKESL